MRFLTKEMCYNANKKHRWEYWRIVIKYLNMLQPYNSLELGSGGNPMVIEGGDTISKNIIEKPNYLLNAADIPWPFKDKQYDVFIALQVWEHLKGKQNVIFQEVARISNWAILSFPYKWPGNSFHSKINKVKIAEWSNPYCPFIKPKIVRSRIIYIFNFSGKKRKIKKKLENI